MEKIYKIYAYINMKTKEHRLIFIYLYFLSLIGLKKTCQIQWKEYKNMKKL